MSFFLSKVLPLLIYPLGLSLLGMLLAQRLAKKPRAQRLLLWGAFLALWLSSTRLVALPFTWTLERQYLTPESLQAAHLASAAAPQADLILVLGGGTRPPQSPRQIPEVAEQGDRFIYAAYLYKLGAAPTVMVTGGSAEWLSGERHPAQDMTTLLGLLGVPAEDIWQEGESLNTYENAIYTQPILAQRQVERFILVTSASHMPRSMAIFRKLGLEPIPAPTDFTVTEADLALMRSPNLATQLFNILPDVFYLQMTTNTLREYIGIVMYWLQGRL